MRLRMSPIAALTLLGALACWPSVADAGPGKQDGQVCVELRLVSLSESMAELFRAKAGFEQNAPEGDEPAIATAFLSAKEVFPWFATFQGDRATNILQAPKITMLNGQHAQIRTGQKQSFVKEYKVVQANDELDLVPHHEEIELGLKCDLLPTVSADRRFVQLKLDFQQSELDGPMSVIPVLLGVGAGFGGGTASHEFHVSVQQPRVQTLALKHTCAIADGRTMVVSVGQLMTEARNDAGGSPLSNITYLNRLFRNVGYGREARTVFLFVTPRIIVDEEVEMQAARDVSRQ